MDKVIKTLLRFIWGVFMAGLGGYSIVEEWKDLLAVPDFWSWLMLWEIILMILYLNVITYGFRWIEKALK